MSEPTNTPQQDSKSAREIYSAVRKTQLEKAAANAAESHNSANAVRIQYLGFRKRLLMFAAIMILFMGYYMLSFVLGIPGGTEFGNAMDALTLGVVKLASLVLPDGVTLTMPIVNVISFTPLGVVFGTCIVSLLLVLGLSFAYAVVATSKARDSHASRFLME